MFALFRKELAAFFSSQIAYLVVAVYLVLTGIFLWILPDSSILSSGYASLEPLFRLSPYLFLLLIPAICMRSIAEELKDGTLELLITRPIGLVKIIGAKYLAALSMVWLSILPTLFYCFTIYQLGLPKGNLDLGATLGSYLGLLLLAAVFTAIGIFSSSLTKNQVIAFIWAALLSFLCFDGFDLISTWPGFSFVEGFLPNLSIQQHYQSLSRGVLDTRDLVFFADLILLFLLFAFAKFSQNVWLSRKQNLHYALFLIFFLTVNIESTRYFLRFDFTAEKRYSLSQTTKNLLGNLKKEVRVTLFLTGDLPSGFKQLSKATQDLVRDFDAYANNGIAITLENPMEGGQADQEKRMAELYALGIEPTNLSVKTEDGLTQKTIFPAALVEYQGKKIALSLLQNRMGATPEEVLNNSIQNLEYSFASALSKLNRTKKPRIGFTEGHGELSDLQLQDAMNSLQDAYEVGRVELKSIQSAGLDKLDLLIVPKPDREFTETEKYKLDYFISGGGHVLWAIDQVNAELDSLKGKAEQLTFAKKLNLDDMLFTYGIRINYDLIADMNCAQIPLNVGNMGGQDQIQLVPWLFYPIIMPQPSHPLVKNLNGIRMEFTSSIDTIARKGIRKSILLTSSPYSKPMPVPALISLQMVEQQPNSESFTGKALPVGVFLEGVFPSVFKNRPLPDGIDESFRKSGSAKPAKMLVLSDGDFLKNQIGADGSVYPLGYDKYTQQEYGNKAFLLNIADYLAGDPELISLRNKEIKIRLLDKARIRSEKRFWQAFNILLPLLLLAIFGFFQHWYRKRRYTS